MTVNAKARALRENRKVGIDQAPSAPACELPYFSEKGKAVGVLEAGIAIGKVTAKVALAQRSEDRVGQRMRGNVGVGVSIESRVMGDRYPAEPERAAGAQRMEIEALPHPKPHRACPLTSVTVRSGCAGAPTAPGALTIS